MLRALGLVEIDGCEPIGSRAQRVVLAALMIDRGSIVSSERLAELVWGDDLPGNPGPSLQNHVSRLRKILPHEATVVAAGSGYRLEAADGDIDLARFEEGFEQAGPLAATDRLGIVEEALGLWRGAPFDELDDPQAAAEAVRLHEIERLLRELRAESLLAVARPQEAIVELDDLRRREPLRERTTELLMRALLDAGRRTEALDAYQSLRLALAEELGLDPSPRLRDLESGILTEEIVAEPMPGAGRQPEPAPTSTSGELPASSFLGRGDDIAHTGRLLGNHRIVTLVGPGGVGKTRLSIHAAAAVAADHDGVTIVELASLEDGSQIGEVVAGALALRPRTDVSTVRRIVEALGGRRHLLVLDNCEHVIDAAAGFVDEATRGAPYLTVLATSREPLNVDGEWLLPVQPLEAGTEAVELFTDRATAARSDFVLDATSRPVVERICQALDGLPLAIELAAARLTTMTLVEIENGLDERFEVFNRGRRTADERHQSLGALVEWSVRELDGDLRTVFTRTSVFAGTFSVDSAAVVCDLSTREVADSLADLADRSLVVGHRDVGQPLRFGFLETVRAYSRALLAADHGSELAIGRHAGWALELAEHMRSHLGSPDESEAVQTVITELAELRRAHQHFIATDDHDGALRLAASLHLLALLRMHAEMFAWIIETAERFGDVDHPDTESVLASASNGCWQSGDLDRARRFAEQAERIASRSNWPAAGRGAAQSMGDVTGFVGDPALASSLLERAVALAREEDDRLHIVSDLVDLAMLLGYQGEIDRVRSLVEEARVRLGPGASAVHAWVDYGEGEALADTEPIEAVAALDRALEEAERRGARFITGVAGLTRAGIQSRLDDPAAAVPGLLRLIHEWQTSGARVQQWITLRTVVGVLVRVAAFEEAATILGAVLAADDAASVAGPDADRLRRQRTLIEEALPDGDDRIDQGRVMDLDTVVDLAITRLTAI